MLNILQKKQAKANLKKYKKAPSIAQINLVLKRKYRHLNMRQCAEIFGIAANNLYKVLKKERQLPPHYWHFFYPDPKVEQMYSIPEDKKTILKINFQNKSLIDEWQSGKTSHQNA